MLETTMFSRATVAYLSGCVQNSTVNIPKYIAGHRVFLLLFPAMEEINRVLYQDLAKHAFKRHQCAVVLITFYITNVLL
jgi:ABC-type nitrate/sulfonate/bicarbonate transport system ATPase subunit